MKKLAIIPVVITAMIVASVLAFDSKQEPSTNNEGMLNTMADNADSSVSRGQYLVRSLGYSDKDLNAILAYLKTVEEK